MVFADVILPIPVPLTYTYKIPEFLVPHAQVGARVVVQLGKSKITTAVIKTIHGIEPSNYQTKEIIDLLDDNPLINSTQMQFYEWMSKYYMSTLGEVLQAALPSGLKVTSESYLQVNPELDFSELDVTNAEEEVITFVNSVDSISFDTLVSKLGKPTHTIIKKMLQKGWLLTYEQIKERYVPKVIKEIGLHPDWQ